MLSIFFITIFFKENHYISPLSLSVFNLNFQPSFLFSSHLTSIHPFHRRPFPTRNRHRKTQHPNLWPDLGGTLFDLFSPHPTLTTTIIVVFAVHNNLISRDNTPIGTLSKSDANAFVATFPPLGLGAPYRSVRRSPPPPHI